MATKLVFGALAALVIAVIAGCGGGGGSDPAPPKETVPPQVVAENVTPKPGATVQKRALTVTLPFTEALACFTGEQAFSDNGFTGQATCQDSVVTMKFDDASLVGKTNVTATLSKLTDLAGNPMVPFTWTYQLQADPATVNLTATPTPTTVAAGTPVTLTWTTTNAANCLATGGWNGTLANTGGSQVVTPTTTTTFSAVCYNANNVATEVATVTVTVTPAPVAKLEYTDVVIARRGNMVPFELFGVNRQGFVPMQNNTGWQLYQIGLRPTPRADCLFEGSGWDSTTGVERLVLLNPKTLEVTRDTSTTRPAWNHFTDYHYTSPLDLINHPTWIFAKVADGHFYTPSTQDPQKSLVNLWFVDSAGVATQLTDTTFNASGKIDGLWAFTCKAQ